MSLFFIGILMGFIRMCEFKGFLSYIVLIVNLRQFLLKIVWLSFISLEGLVAVLDMGRYVGILGRGFFRFGKIHI